jgi:hypothetical protein
MEFATKKLYLPLSLVSSASGVIGAAANLNDNSYWAVTPTAAGLVFTFPAPLDTRPGLSLHVSNLATALSFQAYGVNIAPGQYAEYLWDGTQWTPNAFQQSFNVGEIVASARITLGDPTPVGVRPLSNAFNVATATGVDGSTTAGRVNVVFASPLPTNDYVVNGHLTSVAPGGFANDSQTIWTLADKTTTGFTLVVREVANVVQNLFFDFQISLRRAIGNNVPTFQSTYVGPSTAQNSTVRLDNLIIRYNQATLDVEIALASGTLSVYAHNECIFGNSFINTVGILNLTTTFQILGDPDVTVNGEQRTSYITPTAAGDARAWKFEGQYWTGAAAKNMMRLQRWS